MRVVYQADAGCNHVLRDCDLSGDFLVAGLGVIALVRDIADQVDAAGAGQGGGAAIGEGGVEVVGDAVVLNHGAVAIGDAVQALAVAVGWEVVAEQPGQDDAVGELAGGAEEQDLFVFCRRVPLAVGAGSYGDPW